MTAEQIQPVLAALETICAETAAPPAAMVVFGASGDLVSRKLLPSLAQIQQRDLLSENFCLLGCGRTEYSDEQFRRLTREAIQEGANGGLSDDALHAFVKKVYYLRGDSADPHLYDALKSRLAELRKKHHIEGCNLFYLAVPPVLYETIVEHLGSSGLSRKSEPQCERQARLVVDHEHRRREIAKVVCESGPGRCR